MIEVYENYIPDDSDTKSDLIKKYPELTKYFGFHYDNQGYKNYNILKHYIFERDNYTCQNCGYTPKPKYNNYIYSSCYLLDEIYGHSYISEDRHPSFCPMINIYPSKWFYGKKIPIKPCGDCDFYIINSYSERNKRDLVMHHKNNLPYDNREINLMTLCRNCNSKKEFTKRGEK